ncbi:MAG: trypsin-like serine protease [Acidobacteriota bacterium]
MHRAVRTIITLTGALALSAAPARPITNGEPDGDRHPGVGVLYYRVVRPDFAVNFRFCSGALIADDVFVSAAHCFGGSGFPLNLWISFDPVFTQVESPNDPPADPLPNEPRVRVRQVVQHPAFSHGSPGLDPSDTDVAVLLLDLSSAVGSLPAPSRLPAAGFLDGLSGKHGLGGRTFTAVGYGLADRIVGGGPPYFEDPLERRVSVSEFLALGPAYLVLSMNPSTGDGGTCFGDSGGPNYFDDTDVIAGITITGDAVCRATNVIYRLDTEEARSFLETIPQLDLP